MNLAKREWNYDGNIRHDFTFFSNTLYNNQFDYFSAMMIRRYLPQYSVAGRDELNVSRCVRLYNCEFLFRIISALKQSRRAPTRNFFSIYSWRLNFSIHFPIDCEKCAKFTSDSRLEISRVSFSLTDRTGNYENFLIRILPGFTKVKPLKSCLSVLKIESVLVRISP